MRTVLRCSVHAYGVALVTGLIGKFDGVTIRFYIPPGDKRDDVVKFHRQSFFVKFGLKLQLVRAVMGELGEFDDQEAVDFVHGLEGIV